MRKKTEKPHLLLYLLISLLFCLSGCVAKTDRDDTVSLSEAEMTEEKTQIYLRGKSATCEGNGVSISGGTIIIREPGEYELSGNLKNGKIQVRTGKNAGDVTLILNGVYISRPDGPAIEELEGGKLIIVLEEGTKNTVHSGGKTASEPDPDAVGAAILAEDALTMEGGGSLKVEGFLNNGIAGKKELSILGGTLQIHASNCGISMAKYVEILDGNIQITAGNDGLRTHSDKVAGKGDISISGGNLKLQTAGDGIAAEGTLTISGGRLDISTEGDPEIVSSKGVKAQKDAVITGGELTVTSRDNAVHSKGDLLVSGGSLKLRSDSGKGMMAGGSLRLEGDAELDVAAAGNGIETDTDLIVSGGNLRVISGGDGLRAGDSGTGKGFFRMEGGTVYVSAANDALDAKIGMSVSGGCLFAAGSSYRLKSFSPDSTQASLCAELAEAAEGQITVCTPEGTVLDTLGLDVPARTVHYSSPALKRGESYELHSGSGTASAVAG